MKTERKTFEIKQLTEKGEGQAIIAKLNVIDKDGDVTLPGAFGEQHVNLIGAHDWGSPRLGKGVIREEGDLAIADFKFNLHEWAPNAREWYSALKFDLENGEPLQEWSYGFNPVDTEPGDFQEQRVRLLKLLKVFEISPVLLGAGIETGTLALKGTNPFAVKEEKKEEGQKYVDQADAALAAVKALIDRSEALAALRAEDGRELATTNKERLEKLCVSLADVQNRIKALLDNGGGEDVTKLFAEYEHIKHVHRHVLTS